MTKCPECDAEIKIAEDAMEGEIVTCPDCGASYEIIKSGTVFDLSLIHICAADDSVLV